MSEEVIRYGAGGVIYKGGAGKDPEPQPEPEVEVDVKVTETETTAETVEDAKAETKK